MERFCIRCNKDNPNRKFGDLCEECWDESVKELRKESPYIKDSNREY